MDFMTDYLMTHFSLGDLLLILKYGLIFFAVAIAGIVLCGWFGILRRNNVLLKLIVVLWCLLVPVASLLAGLVWGVGSVVETRSPVIVADVAPPLAGVLREEISQLVETAQLSGDALVDMANNRELGESALDAYLGLQGGRANERWVGMDEESRRVVGSLMSGFLKGQVAPFAGMSPAEISTVLKSISDEEVIVRITKGVSEMLGELRRQVWLSLLILLAFPLLETLVSKLFLDAKPKLSDQ